MFGGVWQCLWQQYPHAPPAVLQSDWVTIGVLCAKGPVKTTSKGGKFTTWFLSDLDGSTMKIFLFDKAFQHHQHVWAH